MDLFISQLPGNGFNPTPLIGSIYTQRLFHLDLCARCFNPTPLIGSIYTRIPAKLNVIC